MKSTVQRRLLEGITFDCAQSKRRPVCVYGQVLFTVAV